MSYAPPPPTQDQYPPPHAQSPQPQQYHQEQPTYPAPPPEIHHVQPYPQSQSQTPNEKLDPPSYASDPNNAQPNGYPAAVDPNQVPQASQYQTASPLYALQKASAPVDCPVCGQRNMTRTEYASGGTTHLSAFLCCICICLGCIPYLVSGLKDVEHRCGNARCGVLLAIWHRSGHTAVQQSGAA